MRFIFLMMLSSVVIAVGTCTVDVSIYIPYGLNDVAYVVEFDYTTPDDWIVVDTLFIPSVDDETICTRDVKLEEFGTDFLGWLKLTLGDLWDRCDLSLHLLLGSRYASGTELFRFMKMYAEALKPDVDVEASEGTTLGTRIEEIVDDMTRSRGSVVLEKALKSVEKGLKILRWRLGPVSRGELEELYEGFRKCDSKGDVVGVEREIVNLAYFTGDLIATLEKTGSDYDFSDLYEAFSKCEVYLLKEKAKMLLGSLKLPPDETDMGLVDAKLKSEDVGPLELIDLIVHLVSHFYAKYGPRRFGELRELLKPPVGFISEKLEEMHRDLLGAWGVLRVLSSGRVMSVVENH